MLQPVTKRRVFIHFKKELLIFKQHWRWIIFIMVATYLHNVSTNIAYYIHTPGDTLWDAGFHVIPEMYALGSVADVLVNVFIAVTCVYFLYPVLFLWKEKHPKVYMATIYIRIFKVMGFTEIIRCITFLSTSLPGSAPHCKLNASDYNPPSNWKEILFRMDATKGCGDLIYSGHDSTIIAFVIVIIHYSIILFPDKKWWKYLIYSALIGFVIMYDIFILAARSHYTVDILVATYFIPALYYCLWNWLPDSRYDDTQIFVDDKQHYGSILINPANESDSKLESGFSIADKNSIM